MFQTLSSADLVKTLEAKHINIDEMHYTDVHAIIAAQKETVVKGTAAEDGKVSETLARTKLYLQQHILNFMHSETEMMRYMTEYVRGPTGDQKASGRYTEMCASFRSQRTV